MPSRSNGSKHNCESRSGVSKPDAQLLSDLWIFRAAAHHQSITSAAAHLSVTQGAVSQRVRRLESRLGVSLFRRHKGRVLLTEAGSEVLDAMDTVAVRVGDALTRIERKARTLVVTCSPTLATEWLMPMLQEFYAECPDVELLLRAEIAPPSAEWMAEQGIDVMIDYLHAGAPNLVELASVREYIFPVCSPSYRARLQQDAKVVLMHDDAAWQEGESAGSEWAEWFAVPCNRRLVVDGERHFNLSYLAYQSAVYSPGLALGRAISVNRLLRTGSLVAAYDDPPVCSAFYRVFALAPADPDTKIGRFASWLQRALLRTQQDTLSRLQTTSG